MKALGIHLAYRGARRLKDIISVLVKYGFQPFMERMRLLRLVSISQRIMGNRLVYDEEGVTIPMRLRLAMEELGPTFIKFGQIMSTRPDIMPEDFIAEFLKLQDEVPPVPFKDAVRVIEAELKKPVSELFQSIDETPVAAASIAQVHRAITLSGEEVVVKIQRPGIRKVIETDVSILGYLAKLMVRYIPEARFHNPVETVEEFSRVIRRELDFTLEASYTEKFRENFRGDERVFVPRVFWPLSSARVLTMERVSGIKVDRVGKLREAGINTEGVAHTIADVFFKQVFVFGLFHGDLHSGNIFVINEGRIALVDFGIVGRIEAGMKDRLADVLICFAKGDFDGLTKVYMKMGILPEDIDRAAFESDYYDTVLHYFGRPFEHVSIGELMMDYIRMAGRHNIRFPKELLLFDKCLIELEGLARVLYPGVDLLKSSEPYARELIEGRIGPASVIREAAKTAGEYREFLEDFPSQANRIMKKMVDDRLRIEFMHKGLEEYIAEIDRSSNRLTFGLIVASLVIGSSLVLSASSTPTILGYPALGFIGFVAASFLGLWLAIQILKSGRF